MSFLIKIGKRLIKTKNSLILTKKMKVFAGLVASALAAPAPVIIGGKNAADGQFPHQVQSQINNQIVY